MKKLLLIFLTLFTLNSCGLVDGLADDLGIRDGEIHTLQDEINSLNSDLRQVEIELEITENKLQDAVDENERLLHQNEIDKLNLEKADLEEKLAEAEAENNVSVS